MGTNSGFIRNTVAGVGMAMAGLGVNPNATTAADLVKTSAKPTTGKKDEFVRDSKGKKNIHIATAAEKIAAAKVEEVQSDTIAEPTEKEKIQTMLTKLTKDPYKFIDQTDVETIANRLIDNGYNFKTAYPIYNGIVFLNRKEAPTEKLNQEDIQKLLEIKNPFILKSIVGALHGVTSPFDNKIRIKSITKKYLPEALQIAKKYDTEGILEEKNKFDYMKEMDDLNALSLNERSLNEEHKQLVKLTINHSIANK